MDRASLDRSLEALRSNFGRGVIPIELPLGNEKNFHGVADLIRMKAYHYPVCGTGKAKEVDIPTELAEGAGKAHEALVEMVAEGNDQLMEKFFEVGTLPAEDVCEELRREFLERRLFPVLCTSGLRNQGSENLLNFIADFFPFPERFENWTALFLAVVSR